MNPSVASGSSFDSGPSGIRLTFGPRKSGYLHKASSGRCAKTRTNLGGSCSKTVSQAEPLSGRRYFDGSMKKTRRRFASIFSDSWINRSNNFCQEGFHSCPSMDSNSLSAPTIPKKAATCFFQFGPASFDRPSETRTIPKVSCTSISRNLSGSSCSRRIKCRTVHFRRGCSWATWENFRSNVVLPIPT